jgi:DNA-binding phage protein
MALTRKFKDTVQKRAASDPEFRHALLVEAINELLAGDYNIAKSVLRDYINATITFPVLAQELHKSSKSVHRMLGPNGNPRMDSIAGILKVLQSKECIKLRTNTL